MQFASRTPNILVVDDFFESPGGVRDIALGQSFEADDRYFKGKRSQRFLWPYLREEFERLLGVRITDWTSQPANGCFQITTADDPIVWHSDSQDYAGAIYLTPEAPLGTGTSFWRDKTYGYRRPPPTVEQCDEVYSEYNLVHPDNWELVDKVGSVFNRLVLWDAKLIHSATGYGGVDERLVQLFFFSVERP